MTEPVIEQPNWERLLDEQEASGQCVADWCRRAGIRPHLIYPRKRERYAKRGQDAARDRARGTEGARDAGGARRGKGKGKVERHAKRARDAAARRAFIPVKVITPPARTRAALRVLAGGRAIEVDGDFDDAVLGRLIAVLESLPCC